MNKPLVSSPGVRSPVVRHPDNPVITGRDVPYRSTLTYNAGVAKWRGRYVMLFRNDVGEWGNPEFDHTDMGLAWSDDGVKWAVEAQPCITVEHAQRLLAPFFPHGGPEETIAIYDPRITVIDGRAYVGFGMSSRHGRRGGLLVTAISTVSGGSASRHRTTATSCSSPRRSAATTSALSGR